MRGATTARLTRTMACSTAMFVVLLATGGCATLRATMSSYEVGPNGITRPQQRLREALVRADYSAALGWEEDDALLRELNTGVSSYYASQFARSASVLDSAALLAEDRITASISKDALALVTNDMARHISHGVPSACSFRTTGCSRMRASSSGKMRQSKHDV